jgi:trk system potassium uptake protein TrkA
MHTKNKNKNFAVLGLGRFGMSIVETLAEYDVNILACDIDEARIHQAADLATHALKADLADESILESLGLGNFDVVIVTMGDKFEASVLAAMFAKEEGAKWVIAKARSLRQKRILENIGADEVVLPEHQMGAKIAAKLVGSNILDILDESDLYTITEMRPLPEWINKTVHQADIRRKHGLTILAIRHKDKLSMPVSPDTKIAADDILITLSEHRK